MQGNFLLNLMLNVYYFQISVSPARIHPRAGQQIMNHVNFAVLENINQIMVPHLA